jgi:hypothetical protein
VDDKVANKEANETNDADEANMAIEANKSKASGVVAADVADIVVLTIVVDKVKEANKASLSIELPLLLPFLSNCRSLFDNGVPIVIYLPFSLTKYSAIFADVKEDFKIITNQLGRLKRG